MKELIFSTGNTQKFAKGQTVCEEYGLKLVQNDLEIDEVQSENTEYVARRKAEAAYALLKQPVIISDDAWAITALNGFPGTYAKSVNHWFAPEDFTRLMHNHEDKTVLLHQTLVYQDEHIQQLFTHSTKGVILPSPAGTTGVPIQKVVSFDGDDGKSISEILSTGTHYVGASTLEVWREFAKWFTEQNS
jgi:non-canonical purine NTP pyrophosphatase (RdgB/HAM1 family)